MNQLILKSGTSHFFVSIYLTNFSLMSTNDKIYLLNASPAS